MESLDGFHFFSRAYPGTLLFMDGLDSLRFQDLDRFFSQDVGSDFGFRGFSGFRIFSFSGFWIFIGLALQRDRMLRFFWFLDLHYLFQTRFFCFWFFWILIRVFQWIWFVFVA